MPGTGDRRGALKIALLYAAFGVAWIFGTDLLAEQIAAGEAQLRLLQTIKGWGFVLASAGLIYALVRRRESELERALRSAEAREDRFRSLLENADDMLFWVASPDFGEFHYLSPSFEELFGVPREAVYEGRNEIIELIHPEDRDTLRENRRRARDDGVYESQEFRVVLPDGRERWMRSQGYPIRGDDGTVERITGVTLEVTARRRALDGLRRSERLHAQAQRIGRLGHWALDISDGKLAWSDEVYRIFGVDPGEFEPTREAFLERVHPEDRSRLEAADEGTMEGGPPLDLEHRIVRPDGEVRFVHERAELVEEGDARRLVGTVQDVTERSRLERRLQRSRDLLRRYAAHLTSARERERRELAREIHDHLGQLLTVMKLQLDREIREAGDERAARLAETVDVVEQAIGEVRDLSGRLRPPDLDQLGLADALAAYVKDFRARTGLDVALAVDLNGRSPEGEAGIHLYRIVQEALTNVARHAGADRARVELRPSDASLLLRVLDDGRGPRSASPETSDSHGLLGMHERAVLMDGEFELRKREGGGTEVRVRVPLAGGELT